MLLAGVACGAEARKQTLELAPPFLGHAVLQRDMPVPVWGWAKKGSTVTVSFAGQKKTAKSDPQGRWKLNLAPLKTSSEGREVTVKASDGESVTLKDILVGEVWFSSGQSNMHWVAAKSMCRELAGKMQRSLGNTYGQDKVAFAYAQPTARLVEGIKKPKIKNAMSVEFGEWPKSLQSIAAELGSLAAQSIHK